MSAEKPRIVVGIATSGRRETLAQNISALARQSRLPDRVVICPVKAHDVDEISLKKFPMPTLVVSGPVGLPAQRNRILAECGADDIIVFFDDDFFADDHYIENLEALFTSRPDIVAVTGSLIADGVNGPGLSVEEGLALLAANPASPGAGDDLIEYYGTYGCNMAFRLEPVIAHDVLFDENLPLYGWQEDIDFSLRVRPYGRIVKSAALCGVHLGIKLGRTSGVRFGYSQIANPAYLIRKGSMSWRHAGKLMWRNIAANIARSFFPEPWVDRKGRLKGNLLALIDIARGRDSPGRILQL
ncbi:MAG TPA: glycosyltransferase [Bradyrhizobium sp.]|nr:glycosyltransferase [Bradyrhizobium sp.]